MIHVLLIHLFHPSPTPSQLQCQLGAYHGLGPEFDALVGDYKRVNADLAHARFQEENFKALNQEMIDD